MESLVFKIPPQTTDNLLNLSFTLFSAVVSQSKRLMNLIFGLGQCFLVEKSMFSGFCFYFQPVQMMSFEGKMRRPFQSCSSELCQAGTFKV